MTSGNKAGARRPLLHPRGGRKPAWNRCLGLLVVLLAASAAGCRDTQKPGYRGPVPCTMRADGGDCLVLDRIAVQDIGAALQALSAYRCPTRPPDPSNVTCHLAGRAGQDVAWFNTVPTGITIGRKDGDIRYVELLYTYNEFDRLAEPMRLQFGEPTSTRDIPYRNNTLPSRQHVWESDAAHIMLFDNSASTSVQITIKRPNRGA